MQQPAGSLLSLVIDGAPEGVVVCDARAPDHPVLYVNPAFERLTGYRSTDLIGRNLRLLDGEDGDQEGCRRLRDSIARGEGCRVTVRNYRKDGSPFWTEILLQPLRVDGPEITHYAAYYRDASGRIKTPERPLEGVPTWLREDRVSGLSSRNWFEELMLRDWALARRDERPLSLMLFDIDGLELYCETFGRAAGDAAIRRIARLITTSFRRGADVIGRWDTGCAAVLTAPAEPEGISTYAQLVAQRVAEMRIHHPRSLMQKFITVSVGVATTVPGRDDADGSRLVRAAEAALLRAQAGGGGLVQMAREADFDEPAPAPAAS